MSIDFIKKYKIPTQIVQNFLEDFTNVEGWHYDNDLSVFFRVCRDDEEIEEIESLLSIKHISYLQFIDGPITIRIDEVNRPVIHASVNSILKSMGRDVTGYQTGVL